MHLISLLIKFICLLIIPFVVLTRLAVYLHTDSNLLPWVCIITSATMTLILLFIYLTFFKLALTNNSDSINSIKRRLLIVFVMVSLYVIHGIFYMSGNNLKSQEMKDEMRSVHPIIRLATSTLIHIDQDLIITDGSRVVEDYKKMGLKAKSHSLHYDQESTGYAHALDLRTKGRPEWRNQLVRAYYWAMGFQTLRHDGTADHLHISLMSHEHPYAK